MIGLRLFRPAENTQSTAVILSSPNSSQTAFCYGIHCETSVLYRFEKNNMKHIRQDFQTWSEPTWYQELKSTRLYKCTIYRSVQENGHSGRVLWKSSRPSGTETPPDLSVDQEPERKHRETLDRTPGIKIPLNKSTQEYIILMIRISGE